MNPPPTPLSTCLRPCEVLQVSRLAISSHSACSFYWAAPSCHDGHSCKRRGQVLFCICSSVFAGLLPPRHAFDLGQILKISTLTRLQKKPCGTLITVAKLEHLPGMSLIRTHAQLQVVMPRSSLRTISSWQAREFSTSVARRAASGAGRFQLGQGACTSLGPHWSLLTAKRPKRCLAELQANKREKNQSPHSS